MTAHHIREIAAAISEGLNCLALMRSLKAAPPVADSAMLEEWRTRLDDLQSSLSAVLAADVVTSLRVNRVLLGSVEDVRAHLSVISSDAPLPATLFHRIDLAWAEIEGAMAVAQASPLSKEPPRMSIEEWAAMPEDDPGELVDGFLMEEEVADFEHETVVSFANATLRSWVVPRGGFVAGSEAKLAIRADQGRKPDLSVYFPGGSIPPRRGPLRAPPDLVIEVISPTSVDARRDRIEKVDDYAAFGVRWYWLIDPSLRAFEVFELGSDRRYVRVLAEAEGSITLPGCVDLTLDLDALWAELDRLGPNCFVEEHSGTVSKP